MDGVASFRPYVSRTGLYLVRGWLLWVIRHRLKEVGEGAIFTSFLVLLIGGTYQVSNPSYKTTNVARNPLQASLAASIQPLAKTAKAKAKIATPQPSTPTSPVAAPPNPVAASVPAVPAPSPAKPYNYNQNNHYAYGNCTYYVANRRDVPSNWGNARNWLAGAKRAGFSTGATPQVGAIAWTSAGYYGHVAIVEEVAGNSVRVSEMNYLGYNRISTRWVAASAFQYIY